MKKILFLFGSYYPNISANGICCDNLMKEMQKKGYDVSCIVYQSSNTDEEEIINGVKVIRIPKPLIERFLDWYKGKKYPNRLPIDIFNLLFKLRQLVSFPFWPISTYKYIRGFYKAAKKILMNGSDYIVIAVNAPFDAIIAGCRIKKKFPNIIFIQYYLDAFSGCWASRHIKDTWKLRKGLSWEKKVFKVADNIIIMKSSENHYAKYFSKELDMKKIIVLDIPLFRTLNVKENDNSYVNNVNKSKIVISFIGSLERGVRNPMYFLEVYKRLPPMNCILYLIGNNQYLEDIKLEDFLNNQISLINYVPHDVALTIMRDSNILLNIGNDIPNMVPSKIFEYMSTGKPIITTCSFKTEPSLYYLKKYDLTLVLNEDDDYTTSACKLQKFIMENNDKKVNSIKLVKTFYNNTSEAFLENLMHIMNKNASG